MSDEVLDEERGYFSRTLALIDDTVAEKDAILRGETSAFFGAGVSAEAVGRVAVTRAASVKERLLSVREHPYHARVDFQEYGERTPEPLYFGMTSVWNGGDLQVCDWRAPAGALFYAAGVGAVSYDAPAGKIVGETLRRREFSIHKGALEHVREIGDGDALRRVTEVMGEKQATGSMQHAVLTLQEDQDRQIRSRAPVLFLQGPAGSGKTVVALHRAAYLLYTLRETSRPEITSRNLLILSPNRIFARYIDDLLPQLHEEAPAQTIFDEFLQARLLACQGFSGARVTFESRLDLLATLSETRGQDFARAARQRFRVKHGRGLMFKLRGFVANRAIEWLETLEKSLPSSVGGAGKSPPVFVAETSLSLLRRSFGEIKSASRAVDSFVERVEKDRSSALLPIDSATRSLAPGDSTRNRLQNARRQIVAAYESALAPVRSQSLRLLYAEFWESLAHDANYRELATETAARFRAPGATRIPYEDLMPLLYLEGLARGFPSFGDIVHALVDEAQDYTPLHIELVRASLPKACGMTLVGDIRQSLDDSLGFSNWDDVARSFYETPERDTLTRSYRSTPQILALSSRLFSPALKVDSLPRDGAIPELSIGANFDEMARAVRDVLSDEMARGVESIAILCPSPSLCEALHDACGEIGRVPDPRVAERPEGIVFLPVYLAKGLEFDSVVVAFADRAHYVTDADRNVLYTACTRALHRLTLACFGEPSPLLPAEENLLRRTR